jgi:hypothetical protein
VCEKLKRFRRVVSWSLLMAVEFRSELRDARAAMQDDARAAYDAAAGIAVL